MNARKPRTKSKNFSSEVTSRLLDLVEELKPFGGNMWERMAFEYNRTDPSAWPERDGVSLKRRFQGLNNKTKPTGTSYCPPDVERAKLLGNPDQAKLAAATDVAQAADLFLSIWIKMEGDAHARDSEWKKEQAELRRQEILEREESKKEQAEQRRRDDETRRQELKAREEREREARKREQQHELVMMSFMAKLLGNSN
ncbi:hypothetical protein H257_01536 [Aphanomyces astaci]|uniref:DUF6818 domain-containing protein n=1 Tax=Aphanomyces astaci TaxID=112090 RepID=W4H9I8_APHAT|nr:hypothetical protein H257_01536 [Aphanomyces astaci]ETV88231.1 hypothetical protein H257_01536 [Aphanomyces astaci]|eukprot:XP_009823094.1 hypothetical protein H257_01536 [Aphanomyces astaci]